MAKFIKINSEIRRVIKFLKHKIVFIITRIFIKEKTLKRLKKIKDAFLFYV